MAIERGRRGPFETWVWSDAAAGARLELAPARGGLLLAARAAGDELLWLDESTFLDSHQNVRGGIPVCFPIAGRLPKDAAEFEGRSIRLPQHGFARNLPWRVREEREDGVECALASSEATRGAFPFEFELRVAYRIVGGALSVESRVENRGEVPMPLHLGFHPYFWVPAAKKGAARFLAAAERAFDNRVGRECSYAPPALGGDEVDLHLLDPRGGAVRLRCPGGPSLRLDHAAFPTLVVWTLPGRDFVCLEPWSAPAGALATGRGLARLAPGDTDARTWFAEREP